MVNITNGTISLGQTVKTGDYENKKAEVSLSFNLVEGTDVDAALSIVEAAVKTRLQSTLFNTAVASPQATPAKAEAKAEKPAKATKMPAAAKAATVDASEVVEEPQTQLKVATLDPVTGEAAKVADPVDDGLGDLLGTESAKEVTDKDLTDATNKCQARTKNSPAIRKVIGEFLAKAGIKMPPGRIIDIPNAERQAYCDALEKIMPLA